MFPNIIRKSFRNKTISQNNPRRPNIELIVPVCNYSKMSIW